MTARQNAVPTGLRAALSLLALAVAIAALAVASPVAAPLAAQGAADGAEAGLRFEVTYPAELREGPLTGRLFLAITPEGDPEPRIAAYNAARRRVSTTPFFATDLEGWEAGEAAVIDGSTDGFPLESLDGLEPGTYHVQAVLHVYTRFERSDGHVIWAPMDQWEGQRWAFSPGNLVSEPRQIELDPAEGGTVSLRLARALPPIDVPEDTEWVKRLKFESPMLSEFWGHPIYLGATVLLPEGYHEHPDRRYPVVYVQGHFSLEPPFGFSPEPLPSSDLFSEMKEEAAGVEEDGHTFYRSWIADGFPRVIAVTFQHPTPYFDDSYAVNSANNGPYGDALLQELVPRVESEFRAIGEPWARVLTGGSTGGWESLALQLKHPRFFGGTWTFFPDPVDFRRYQLIDIYEEESAFLVPGAGYGDPERMFQRTPDGQPVATVRQISRLEAAQGSRGRSGAQIDAWNAAYGPVGEDGYPERLWDLETGEIDRGVARYMRDNGYDLRHYVEENWAEIGPDLVGKIRIYNPEMDHFYLPLAVYLMEDFLESTTDPHYDGAVIHGRPMKGHGWQPMTNADMIREMSRHMAERAPEGASLDWLGEAGGGG